MKCYEWCIVSIHVSKMIYIACVIFIVGINFTYFLAFSGRFIKHFLPCTKFFSHEIFFSASPNAKAKVKLIPTIKYIRIQMCTKFPWYFEKLMIDEIIVDKMSSVFIVYFFSTHAMSLIQRALQILDILKAPRCFEHYFWSQKKNVRATWRDAFNMMKIAKIL